MARIVGPCLVIVLICVFWKAQGQQNCDVHDMGKAVALIVQVKNDVAILQETVSSQQKTIEKMKKNEETLKKKEDEMERTMETMKQKEEEVERTMETMKQKEDEMERTMETMKQKEEEMERSMETMKGKEKEMERTIDALKKHNAMVGFSVHSPKTVSSGVMTFSTTVTNVGSSYDVDTGIFTCTTPGHYFFSVSLIKNFNYRSYANCKIYKNSDYLVEAYTQPSTSHNSFTTAVTSVLVHLAVGDRVKLAACTEIGTFLRGKYSTFTGFMVRPDA